ncbi:carboxypeptidase-like regulatory domain-containing protein [Kordia algicida OT-1]|uniref:Uncharacterized protein n=1 Tax=Kordia algicida OT-1 TaxID=391587 RepID=A9E9V3_9FLAO|nr:carboxypeptidase-like regulatory domain-containing protein [Kordia algicida]EDP94708.1 hypothetical protein KAOT1_00490 [Kordia algicida OT-1]
MHLDYFSYKISFFLTIILFSVCKINAQNIELFGKITDSSLVEIEFANVLAIPNDKTNKVKFAITNSKGNYKIRLKSFSSYTFTISHLGFKKQVINLTTDSLNIEKNIVLIEEKEELGTVTINYTPPVTIKQDTIIYKTDAFTSGEERKLRDVLKKLPNVEVDRKGNVYIQGKKVTKVLVENKEFFTGNSKLAVNNIPADAVDKIEILDNYNEVFFLKNLEDTDDMAMNVKLKENKKKFLFGDIEAGGGIVDRYSIHPSLYYYSPKTTFNLIGDFNNTGVKSFTVEDYVSFEGGMRNFLDNRESYFNLTNDSFSRFLNNTDYKENKNNFGALSYTQELTSNTELSSYLIHSKISYETKQEFLNEYFSEEQFTENRVINGMQDIDFSIGKIKLTSKKNINSNLRSSITIKSYKYDIFENTLTQTNANSNYIETSANNITTFVNNDIQWNKKYNDNHTFSVYGKYSFNNGNSLNNLLTNSAIFESVLPLEQSESYSIFKDVYSLSHNVLGGVKHYWIMNRLSHIYTTFGVKYDFQKYQTNEFQLLDNNTQNNFENSNFNNDVKLTLGDIFFGVHYKLKKGKITFKPALFYHTYIWNFTQFRTDRVSENQHIILPQLSTDFSFTKTKKISFKYDYTTRFPSITQLSNRITLLNFNSLYVGNETLKNERIHKLKLRFSNFNLFKDLYYSLILNYQTKGINTKNETNLEGINSITTPSQFNFADSFFILGGSISKGYEKIKFSLRANINKVDYDTPLNGELINNNTISFNIGSGFSTRFENYPNIEVNYNKSISKYSSVFNNQFNQNTLSTFLEYNFLKSIIIKANYKYENYTNNEQNITNEFNILDTSFYYQKPNTAWGFELSAKNLLNIKFQQRNSLSNVLISDERTFILPRIIMFKLTYKL